MLEVNNIIQAIVEKNGINQDINEWIKSLNVVAIENLSSTIAGSKSFNNQKKSDFLQQLIDATNNYPDAARKCIARSIGAEMDKSFSNKLISYIIDKMSDAPMLGDMVIVKLVGDKAYETLNTSEVISKITDISVLKKIARSCLLTSDITLKNECIEAVLAKKELALFEILASDIAMLSAIDPALQGFLHHIVREADGNGNLLKYLAFAVFLNKDNLLSSESRAALLQHPSFLKSGYVLLDSIAKETADSTLIIPNDKVNLLLEIAMILRDNRIEIHDRIVDDMKTAVNQIATDAAFLDTLHKIRIASNDADTLCADQIGIIICPT